MFVELGHRVNLELDFMSVLIFLSERFKKNRNLRFVGVSNNILTKKSSLSVSMCDSKPSPEITTRFCVSVEQMVPYLENLCKVDEDEDEDEDENNVEFCDITNDNCNNDEQPPIVEPVINETVPPVPDEIIPYIDISMLNPIVEAYACLQKDELNEEGIFCHSSFYH